MGLADAYRYATQVMVENMMARDAAKASAPSSRSALRTGKTGNAALSHWPRISDFRADLAHKGLKPFDKH